MTNGLYSDENCFNAAINQLKEKNYLKAEEYIKQMMLANPHSPVAHNLYGILEELMREERLACRHYRAACALDPAYKPAIRNLERITDFNLGMGKTVDYGDRPEEEAENRDVFAYARHIGHLVKKKKE